MSIVPKELLEPLINRRAAARSVTKGRAIVSYDREISDKQIRDAVEEAGYKVTGIQ